jgi:ABC-type phosphate transport system substrate-binding protein
MGMAARYTRVLFYRAGQRWTGALLSLAVSFGALVLYSDKSATAAAPAPQVYAATDRAGALSRETLREIFFMRLMAWPDGTPIRVFVLPDKHPLHIRFTKEILGVYPFQLRTAWDRLVYSGTGLAPVTVETVDEMRQRVKATPGGIGYVDN